MQFLKAGLTFIIVINLCHLSQCQYKSFDLSFNASSISDDYEDEEYIYDSFSGVQLGQIDFGYTFSINNKLTLSPRVAYAFSHAKYFKRQISISSGSLADRTYIEKIQRSSHLKSGLALSYWITKLGKGLYLEAELQNLTFLSGKSKEMKRVNSEDIEEYTVDYSDSFKSNVQSLKLGVGFNLPVNRIGLFVRVGLDLRLSTYFNSTDNYTFVNRSLAFGIRYKLKDSKGQESVEI